MEKAAPADDPSLLFVDFVCLVRSAIGRRLVVVIDNYDRFMESLPAHPAADAAFRSFFSQLKRCASEQGVIARLFLTGVTVASLDAPAAGFSIAKNLSAFPDFAAWGGFSEAEVKALISQWPGLQAAGGSAKELAARLRTWCGSYRFSFDSGTTVFHPGLCLQCLKALHSPCATRSALPALDASDFHRLHGILQFARRSTLEEVAQQIADRRPIAFGREPAMLSWTSDRRLSKNSFLSALFYFGCLTYAPDSRPTLTVPNDAMAQFLLSEDSPLLQSLG